MSETAVNGVEPIIFLDDVHVTFRTRTGSILHPNLVHAVQGVLEFFMRQRLCLRMN